MTAVTVVGDALLDVSVRPAAPVRSGADVPAEIRVRAGGQGANLAVRLARRGVDVTLVCGIGDDAAGGLVRDALAADGVRPRPVEVAATGTVVILVEATGERTMLSDRSPFGTAAVAAVPSGADWLVASGYLLLEAGATAVAGSLAATSERRALVGCTVPNGAVRQWRDAAAAFRPDLVILNREERDALHGDAAPAAGVVVTDRDGAHATIGPVTLDVAAPAGSGVVDTTGAGDAFAAALIADLAAGDWPPSREALEAALGDAIGLAGEVARVPGSQARVPTEAGRHR